MSEEQKSMDMPMKDKASPVSSTRKPSSWLPVAVLCGVFLIGFVPMWLKSNRLNTELARAQRHARFDQIHITFADATLDARRGDYEPARQKMTKLFTLVSAEMDRGIGTVLAGNVVEELKPLLAQRDDLITLLARGDPASAERLANAYAGFRKAVGD